MRLSNTIVCATLTLFCSANNITVSNISLTGNTGTTALVQFDLSWANGWRGGGVNNWDAAWVFVKYRTIGGIWQHVLLNGTGHTAPSGSMIDLGLLTPGGTPWNAISNPAIGVFVRRNADGNGAFALTDVELRWDYASQGLAYNDIIQVQVFAIEMAHVPQGAFAAGSGGTETSAFTLTTINTGFANTTPFGTGSLGGLAGGYPTGQTAPANNTWPNGFGAFYCMKYELSQQGYVDFLNTLPYNQQLTRTIVAPNSAAGIGALNSGNAARSGIDIQVPGVASSTPAIYACNLNGNGVYGEATDGSDIACNFLSCVDVMAYLDWSGLRPMTELEFEKACRGTLPPLANEFPWGTTGAAAGGASAYTIMNDGASNEGIATNYSTTVGNALYTSTVGILNGPLRVGTFAANGANTGRITAGASYYGIMELGGNLGERPVTIGNVEGRLFTGLHGNGTLAADGSPNVTAWPATAVGVGTRGGGYTDALTLLRVSDRAAASIADGSHYSFNGGRGVRSAP